MDQDSYEAGYAQAMRDVRSYAEIAGRTKGTVQQVEVDLRGQMSPDFIRAHRLQQGWTQGYLAELVSSAGVHFTKTDVSRVENGLRELTYAEHETIREVLGA